MASTHRSPELAGRRGVLRKLSFALVALVVFFALTEGILRLAGLPTGRFRFVFEERDLLYRPSMQGVADWGPVPYRVETNSLGMRGPEIRPDKPRGVTRIAAVGDSITDGFFVDDDQTYPARLQRTLREQGHRVEVLNAAKAGGSIDRELRIVRQIAHLGPDVVVITFCTNDIADVLGRTREELLDPDARTSAAALQRFLVGHTAIGEYFFTALVRNESRAPVAALTQNPSLRGDVDPRYAIAGGTEFRQNAQVFLERYADSDGLVLESEFQPEVEAATRNYLEVLAVVQDLCRDQGVDLVLAYFPAYPEIYDARIPSVMRDRLAEWCASRELRFLDLTPAFREHGRERALHLAPVDFHLNPEGNRVFAEVVAEFLVAEGLVGRE